MFNLQSFTIPVLTLISLFPLISQSVCLPCQAAFRRPDGIGIGTGTGTRQRTLRARDSSSTITNSGSGSGSGNAIHILNPSYRSVWFNGELQLVTWNNTDIASTSTSTTNSGCQVYLAQWDWNTKDYKKIYLDFPLATNCDLHNGNTTVRVPKDDKFKPGNNWIVVLFNRNADDHSAPFTIAAPPPPSPPEGQSS